MPGALKAGVMPDCPCLPVPQLLPHNPTVPRSAVAVVSAADCTCTPALAKFARKHFPRACRGLVRRGVPAADAEDLVQDVLKALWEARHGVPRCAWRSWFETALTKRQVARSRNILRAMERGGEIAYEVSLRSSPPGAVQEQEAAAEQRAAFGEMVDALVPREREVVRLHACDEVPMSEVAQRQKIGEKAAWNRWTLAKERLVLAGKRWRARESFELIAASVLLFLLFVRRLWTVRGRRSAGPAMVLAAASLCCCGDTPSGTVEVVSEELPLARESLPAAAWAFSAAWAERERESGSESAVASSSRPDDDRTHAAALAKSAPSSTPRSRTITSPPAVDARLFKARAALRSGDLAATAEALRLYEVDHPDPTLNDLHKNLRIELGLTHLDKKRPPR